MAYKAVYKRKIKVDADNQKIYKSSLEAKFNFWEETPPKNRKIIRGRMKDFFEKVKKKEKKLESPYIPEEYLLWEISSSASYYGGWADINSIRGTFALKFDISFFAEGNIPYEKMVDLDAINDYILTGKKKENN